MKYTTIEKIESYTLLDIKGYFEPQVERWIEAVSQYISRSTNRQFIADTEFEDKVYDGTGARLLVVHDLVELNNVKQGEDEMEVYQYPSNTTPKTWLESDQVFRAGRQNITVNAKWGYSEEVPADIEFAATVLVSGIINDANPLEKSLESESIGQYRVSYRNSKEVSDFNKIKEILWLYRRHL